MKDSFGCDFSVGDYLVYVTRQSSSIYIKAAKVTAVHDGWMEVNVYDEGRYHNTVYKAKLRTPANIIKVDGFDHDVEIYLQ